MRTRSVVRKPSRTCPGCGQPLKRETKCNSPACYSNRLIRSVVSDTLAKGIYYLITGGPKEDKK